MKKLTLNQLMWRAFCDAEYWQDSLADSWGRNTPEGIKADEIAKQLRNYRLKRWGRTEFEAATEKMTTKTFPEIMEMVRNKSLRAEKEEGR